MLFFRLPIHVLAILIHKLQTLDHARCTAFGNWAEHRLWGVSCRHRSPHYNRRVQSTAPGQKQSLNLTYFLETALMSVRELGKLISAGLGKRLKSHGFSRSGARLSRGQGQYVEHYAIDGNRWQSGALPWEFSVDVGVFFHDIPERAGAKGLWRHSHAVGCMDRIVKDSPPSFLVFPDTVDDVADEVAKIILMTSEHLPGIVSPAYIRAKNGWASPLPVPSTWDL